MDRFIIFDFQTKEVIVDRIVIENSIEDRIMGLQRSKQAMVDGVLGEGSAVKGDMRLNINDLMRLFQ